MALASPIWLLALIPWGAMTLWLLQARRARVAVPYLPLWESNAAVPPPRRKMQSLPLAVLLALLAALLGVLAGARPTIRWAGAGEQTPVTVIVDRGLRMSAQDNGEPRYLEAAGAMINALPAFERSRPVELFPVPGSAPIQTTFADCAKALGSVPPTARDTRDVLAGSIAARLGATSGPVVVITDAAIAARDRLIQVSPGSVVHDAGIALLAARDLPVPQVMVRVRNQSDLKAASIVVSCDDRKERQTVELPPRNGTRDYFFTPPRLGTVVSAELVVKDDLPADDRAWLVREGNRPAIEAATALPAELRRLIDAYQRSRPATDGSSRLAIVGAPAQLPSSAPAVLIASAPAASISGAIQAAAHPVTAHVAWDQMPMPLGIAGEAPAGWTPLVSVNGRPIVAVRPDGPRQLWVGFTAPSWPTMPDYVVFWTNVFDWAGGGGASFTGHPLADWSPEWKPAEPGIAEAGMWPGLYRRSDGALRAFNPPDVVFAPPPHTDWKNQLAALGGSSHSLDVSGRLLVAAAACIVLASLCWKRRRKPVVANRELPVPV
jgi:hypothetical protein